MTVKERMLLVMVVVLMLGAMALVLAPNSHATEKKPSPAPAPATMTVVWEMPSWLNPTTPTWAQRYVASAKNVGLEFQIEKDCGYFQIDEYRYETKADKADVDKLIAGGVLNGPNNPSHEPLIQWRLENKGTCETESPSPSPSPSTSTTESSTPTATPTDTPSETASSTASASASASTTVIPSTTPPGAESPTPVTTIGKACTPTTCLAETGGGGAGGLAGVGAALAAAGGGLAWFGRKRTGKHVA